MRVESKIMSVRDILSLRRNGMLSINSEYQRGAVWSVSQRRRLIDSVFREYPLPLIYLDHIKKEVAGMMREDLEVIDGQQRIDALFYFAEGAFKLFDPIKDDKEARFPEFIKQAPCPWAGCDFGSLSSELQQKFLDTRLSVAHLTSGSPHEARDLFIRLQAGKPLNAQEKRDAWPGGFSEFVLKLGGKPEIARYQGHEFFRKLVTGRSTAARGKARQLCAQMAMLLIQRHRHGSYIDVSTKAVDDFYYRHLDFDPKSPLASRFERILDVLVSRLGDGTRRTLKGHEAIHLMLLVDELLDSYSSSWQSLLAGAFDQFIVRSAQDKKTKNSSVPGEFWTHYDAWTRTNSDRADTIRHRHEFFARKMHEFMPQLRKKDETRLFTEEDRILIYNRDGKRCWKCTGTIEWDQLEIHHVIEHAKGGQTVLANGVSVHRHCHPKGKAAEDFAATVQLVGA
jgi:hypothetical protein